MKPLKEKINNLKIQVQKLEKLNLSEFDEEFLSVKNLVKEVHS